MVPALARLKSLKYLMLSRVRIDDEGLRDLAALKGLKELHLVGTQTFSDDGVRFLASLESLEALSLENNHITSRSARAIVGLKKLKHLVLSNTRFDDEGLRSLAKLTELEVLLMGGTAITNVGRDLRFPTLMYLDLSNRPC